MPVEWLAVPVEDHLGSGPADLWPVLGHAGFLGARISAHILVGEARQAQIEGVAA